MPCSLLCVTATDAHVHRAKQQVQCSGASHLANISLLDHPAGMLSRAEGAC